MWRTWMKKFLFIWVFIFVSGLIFGAGYSTALLAGDMLTPDLIANDREVIEETTALEPEVQKIVIDDVNDVITTNPVSLVSEVAGPSIVTVVSTTDVVRPNLFSYETYEAEGVGSGVVYKYEDELLIVTNYHVVNGAKAVTIIMPTGEELEGQVEGYDSRNDVALVSVSAEELEKKNVEKIVVANFGDSEAIKSGELAVAIGNPLGKEFSQTVTAGVISAVDRELEVDGETLHVIQTDAAINPGNSGGGLFNAAGEVIGINTIKLVDASVEGMGFAIPSHIVLPIIDEIDKVRDGEDLAYHLSEERAYLGISMGASIPEESLGFGVYVAEVVEDGPADKAGIEVGDIIIGVEDKKILDNSMLFDTFTELNPFDKVSMTLIRDEQVVTVQVELGRYGDYAEEDRN